MKFDVLTGITIAWPSLGQVPGLGPQEAQLEDVAACGPHGQKGQ